MLNEIHPKLPMRSHSTTLRFYKKLGFEQVGGHYSDYLMMRRDSVEIHFFLFEGLNPLENYGQVYIRTADIDDYFSQLVDNDIAIHPNGNLETKPWGQREFSLLDPDNNLLTFGQSA